jgi:hypothetical protein
VDSGDPLARRIRFQLRHGRLGAERQVRNLSFAALRGWRSASSTKISYARPIASTPYSARGCAAPAVACASAGGDGAHRARARRPRTTAAI